MTFGILHFKLFIFASYMGSYMKKLIIVCLTILCSVNISGCEAIPEEKVENTYTQINAEQAKRIMDENTDYIILDVRTQAEYDTGHIAGALLLPNENIGTEDIEMLPDKAQLILIYCRSGNRSKQASEKLVKLGYTSIYEFGGVNDWIYGLV